MAVCATEAKTGRNPTIDVVKGIGILLVVFAHINYTPVPLTYIYSFHMPLFFILSGLLFRKEKYNSFGQFLTHRFYSLICPYLFFYTVALIISILMALVSGGLSRVLSSNTLIAFVQMFLAWGPSGTPNNPLWFVPCLFCVEIVYFFTSKTKPWINGVICIALVVLGWLMKSDLSHIRRLRLLWNFDISLFAIGFYALGNLLSNKLISLQQMLSPKKPLCAVIALLCAVILYPLAMYNGKVSLGSGIYESGILLYATGMIGTLGVLFAASAIGSSRFLQYLGKNTFAIMGTHYVIRNVLYSFCSAVNIDLYDRENIVQSILPFVLVLSASIVCTEIYNRTKPVVLNRKNTHL